MASIHLRRDGPAARLLVDNIQRKNAITRAMWRAIPGLVAEAVAQPDCRIVTLQSAAPASFAAGADISEFAATYSSAAESLRANAEIRAAVEAMADCPLPTLALIDGPCLGGGVSLSLACDIRVASARATFAITPARLGLSYHPNDVTRLVRACGRATASELLFSGQVWSAQRSVSAGLANHLWSVEEFTEASEKLVADICANSLEAILALKRTLKAVASSDPEALRQAEAEFSALFSGADFHEGRDAFLQRRKPDFLARR